MIKKINAEYDNEILIGRISSVKEGNKGVLQLSLVENYDDRREGVEAKFISVAAFETNAERMRTLGSKLENGLIGCVVAVSLRTKETEQGTSRVINWFQVVRFPQKKN